MEERKKKRLSVLGSRDGAREKKKREKRVGKKKKKERGRGPGKTVPPRKGGGPEERKSRSKKKDSEIFVEGGSGPKRLKHRAGRVKRLLIKGGEILKVL